MSILTHGLSALMEACKQSTSAEESNEALFEAFDEVIDDELQSYMIGDDSVENDMEGEILDDEDEKKIAELVKAIPPADEDIEEKIDSLTESVIPSDELKYVY